MYKIVLGCLCLYCCTKYSLTIYTLNNPKLIWMNYEWIETIYPVFRCIAESGRGTFYICASKASSAETFIHQSPTREIGHVLSFASHCADLCTTHVRHRIGLRGGNILQIYNCSWNAFSWIKNALFQNKFRCNMCRFLFTKNNRQFSWIFW